MNEQRRPAKSAAATTSPAERSTLGRRKPVARVCEGRG